MSFAHGYLDPDLHLRRLKIFARQHDAVVPLLFFYIKNYRRENAWGMKNDGAATFLQPKFYLPSTSLAIQRACFDASLLHVLHKTYQRVVNLSGVAVQPPTRALE